MGARIYKLSLLDMAMLIILDPFHSELNVFQTLSPKYLWLTPLLLKLDPFMNEVVTKGSNFSFFGFLYVYIFEGICIQLKITIL